LLGLAGPVRAAEEFSSGPCSLRVLTPADAGDLPRSYRDYVRPLSQKHRDVVNEALKVMSPLLCAAAQRVVFVDHPTYSGEDGWVLPSEPDLVFINYVGSTPFLKAVQALVHESTHAAELLMQAHRVEEGLFESSEDLFKGDGDDVDSSHWSASANAMAKRIVESNRLGGGFRAEWQRMHRTFQGLGLAGGYLGSAGLDRDSGENTVTKEGFTSFYGSTLPGEDASEFTSWILVAPLHEREWEDYASPGPPRDYACQDMRSHGESTIPAAMAVLFTKVNLLLSTELITKEDYERCVGQLEIEAPGKGIFAYRVNPPDAGLRYRFTDGLSATIGMHPQLEQQVFLLKASGRAEYSDKEYPAHITVRIPMGTSEDETERISWPRGVYNLDQLGGRFSFEMEGAKSGTFINLSVSPDGASTCTVLIAHASNERLEGSIFLRHAIRPFAPVPVPQTGMPLRFTFKLEK
jgi:hypothetical protein